MPRGVLRLRLAEHPLEHALRDGVVAAAAPRKDGARHGSGRLVGMQRSVQRLQVLHAAEAREAVYTVAAGIVEMTGDVLLTQGASALSGQRLVLDLKAGTGVMEGRVSTTFVPGGN